MDDASRVLNRDSESTSRPKNVSEEENEASRRDLESASRLDDLSGVEYDVFLSFRGSDTRLNFTDYLYHSMVHAGIRVFLDSEELEVGEKISEVLNALNKSRIYIPIFSKNFASSIWCLREVERMGECHSKSNGKKEIIPIFYDVKSDDVKLRTYLYKNAILRHKKTKKFASEEVQRWESALRKVGKIIGLELQGKRQGEQIDSIVEKVSRKLDTRHTGVTDYFVKDSAQVEAIMKLLDVGSDGVRFVGIHGTGGIGKTTLAKVIFNQLYFYFGGSCFLTDVRAASQPHGGLLNLQKMLLSSFLSPRVTDDIKNVDHGIEMIKRIFSKRTVLLVLDDLDKKEQLENLVGKSNWFCSGSRIIITTRDKSILVAQVDSSDNEVLNQPKRILDYEVQEMKFNLALDLFYKHAFRSDSAAKEYDDFSNKIVRKVGMLPLAVVVAGSYLFELGNDLGNLDKRKVWDDMLKKLEEGPFDEVRKVLMISYERLEPKEKEVFLDIACFFTNEDKTYPVIMWDDCNYYPHIAMRVLAQRSLIKIREDNRLWMHDQVRDFGRYIVLEEYPRKFCRVWTPEKALKLLERKERNDDVEALVGRSFTREELACLPSLRFLRVKESNFSGNFKDLLSELRWLSWQTWQTTFHANNLHLSNLVVLDLSYSNIENGWGGWRQMKVTKKLKVLDLTGCTKLTGTPDFSNFTSLESLILARCLNLITIDRSLGKLEYLKTLNIKGCSSLGELPEEVGSLHSLIEIIMPQSFHLLKLPERFGELKSLSSFILDNHPGVSQLPKSIGGLVKLTCLSLHGCVGIKELPPSIGELQMLIELDISMSGIAILPDSIGKLKKLRLMRLAYTAITKFPRTIGLVEMLEELVAKKCWDLTEENMEEIGKLSHLKTLNLSYTHICRLPEEIGHLSHLQTLEFGSMKLQEATALPSSLTSLEVQAIDFSFIPNFSSLVNLHYLELYRLSTFLKKEPYSTWENDPEYMEEAWGKEQPIHQLPTHLSTLKLKGISPLPHFSKLEGLSVLRVSEFPMSCLPVSQGLIHLRELKISRCEFLEKIPGLSLLKSLQRLVLNSLNKLVEIPGLSELKSLQYLRLSRCRLIEGLPNLSNLDKLQHLELQGCPNLRAIEGVKGLESWELDSHGRTILERLLDVSKTTWLCHKLPMYDVFLSYRGPDTRYSIIRLLHDNLSRSRISFFRDDDELNPGEGIGEEIQQALNDSYIYMPVFSKSYASSQWCLRQLARIVKLTSESKGERRILPIFYNVEVDDVKLKSKLYQEDLDKHYEWFEEEEVYEWKEALKEVAQIKGFDLKTNSPQELIELVVQEVLYKLDVKNLDVPEYLVEDPQMKAIAEKSEVDFDGVPGAGSIGKTELANVVFNKSTSEEDQNQPKGILAYEVHEMEFGQAFKLFCNHAFKRDSPLEGYDHLVEKIVCRVGMHPLAVEVIGSSLYFQGLGFDLEQHFDKRKLWEDTLKQLDEGPFKDVRDAIMISYEGLENTQKEIFLDIACFFTNEDQTYPVIMWDDCYYHPHSAIGVLLSRSLIKIRDNKFWMHDQVQDLGRHIVLEKYPHKFSRVWTHEDALELLQRKKGTSKVKALRLDKYGCGSYTSEQFKELTNLRFLQVNGANFTGDFHNLLPQLRWLQWERCPLYFAASNFLLKKLVVLTLSWSEISENWGGWFLLKMASKLKVLNLASCHFLRRTPDLSALESLEIFILKDCKNLEEIDPSIGKLTSLTELDLKSTMVVELPKSIENLQNLRILDIRDTRITKLPGAIEMLAKLQLCVKKSHLETMPLKTQREASAPSILLPREGMKKMKDESRQRQADMETSDRSYAIAAVQNVVGIDDRVKQISDLLEIEVGDEVRIIGIFGTDGIGKTTLAKAVYDRISSCFDSCSFLAEVEETAQNSGGMQFLQTKLIHDILKRVRGVPSFDETIELFLDIFRERKVLIVVDDVENQFHLRAIVGDRLHWFGQGSRIIVTSENEEILKEFDSGKVSMYMVSQLDNGQAAELFRKHAFRMQSSWLDYDELANLIVSATVKLPLAVEVIGSFLRGKSIEEWEKMENSMKLLATNSQKTTVGFEEILDICYKGLDQQQKDIFLDIACFILGADVRIASYMWPNSYLPSFDCILMPLAKIGENNELQMHRLLRCFGKRILNREGSGDPIQRKFYIPDMVPKAISREKGMEDVEALWFDLDDHASCIFTPGDFESMPDIRFLKLDSAKLSGNFAGAFPSLRWFCWQRCPLDFEATNLVLREVVILDLSGSKVTEEWGGWSEIKMEKLKVLNLTRCSDLLITPNLSNYKDLEILILEQCSHLVKLDPSIGHLKRLVSLNLKFCSQLNGLPVELGGMTSLKELFIDATSVREIPISIGNLKQLEILSGFKCFPLTYLPSSISYLTALCKLSLDGAKLTELPSSLGELLNLRRLSLRDCRYMEELPDSIGKMGSLEELDISATSISMLPNSIRNLQSLRVLRMDSSFIGAFPGEIGNLTKLEELHASGCRSLKGAIPSVIKELHVLQSLMLGHSSISSLPSEISTISGLLTLDLLQCNEIEELPKLPPSLICLRVSSKRMKAIPLLEDLKELEELCLSDGNLKSRRPPSKQPMPESYVKQMTDKPSFSISFPKLRKLELSLSQIIKLKFELTDIAHLEMLTLPGLSHKEVSELPKTLSVFELYHSAVEEIEGLEGLEALKRLDISNCKIQNLHGIGQLTSLRSLILSDCGDLSLPDLSNLKLLKVLEIRRCKMIRQIEGLGKLTSLVKLNISECPAENSVQVQNAMKHVMACSMVM